MARRNGLALGLVIAHRRRTMLVLSRKIGQRIKIGDSVIITLVQVNGASVRIGIEAPHDLEILREELLTRAAHPRAAGNAG
jgi:carbon storage regulator